MSEIMLRVENVSKEYVLGQIGGTTLREELQRVNARLHHREDPTRRVDQMYTAGERFIALDGVSFDVKKGEKIGIIGHNGAGKSTLLKLISRVTAPSKGRICLNGRVASMLEVGTGFHGELTGRENIYMNGAILGMKKKEIDEKIEDIIEFSECRQFIDTPVKRYSSGMYVKLAFSVAAHLDAEIMIMDEVLAVGDMAFQKKCINKMNAVAEAEDRTILYVSHNMNTIRQLCDRCIVLDHGKIIFDGDVEKAIAFYFGYMRRDQLRVDLTGFKREEYLKPFRIRMEEIALTGREDPIIETGEELHLELTVNNPDEEADVYLRMIIASMDSNPIMMSATDRPVSLPAGKSYKVRFAVDTSHLAPGNYYLSPNISLMAKEGAYISQDLVHNAFAFDIVKGDGFNNDVPWRTRYWGNFCPEPLRIEEEGI